MIPQYEVRAEDIRRYTIEKMKEHFSVKAHTSIAVRRI